MTESNRTKVPHTIRAILALALVFGVTAPAGAAHFLYTGGHGLDTGRLSTFGGHTFTTFSPSDSGWASALSGGLGSFDAIVVGENNNAFGISASTYSDIAAYVSGGGRLIVAGDHGSRVAHFLNTAFGYAVSVSIPCGSSNSVAGTLQAAAAGTSFDGGPASVLNSSCTTHLASATVPTGATVIYEGGSGVLVLMDGFGAGVVGFYGWDFCCGAGLDDWYRVFDSALGFFADPDVDDDGVLNVDDNCIFDSNPLQEDGDADGAGDVCDTCPDIPNPDQDNAAACIAVSPADATCMEAQVELISAEIVDGDVTIEQLTPQPPLSFTKPDFTSDVDVIDTNLRITRGCCGGVFNQGPDVIEWANGSCAAPTSTFYPSFNSLLFAHYRFRPPDFLPVYLSLPGSDTCLHNVTTDTFYDVRWDSWSCCARGGFAYTRTQQDALETVVTVPYTDSTLPAEIDISTLTPGDYELCVSTRQQQFSSIDSLTFDILNTCGESFRNPGTYELFLNGVSMGTITPGSHCTCTPPLDTLTVTSPSLLANWTATGSNTVSFVLTNTADYFGTWYPYLAWVRAEAASGTATAQACIFDQDASAGGVPTAGGGNCDVLSLCDAGYTYARSTPTLTNETNEFGGRTEKDCVSFTVTSEGTIVINGSCNQPPVCSAAGPAGPAECAGATTAIAGLDGTASSDPDGDAISFSWATDCTGGVFDDAASATPTLTVDSPVAAVCPGPLTCNATLTVTDIPGGLSDTCAANAVSVDDTVAPVLTVDTTPITVTDADCSGDEPATLPTASASDQCDPAVPVGDDAPGTFPAGATTTVTYTATDDCSNSSTDGVDVTVLYGADIAISANKHTVGGGTYPGSSKEPLVGIEVCAYDKAEGSCSRVTCGGISHQHYQCIVDSCGTDDGEQIYCCTTDANGECTINAPPGDYVVISDDATKTTLPDPLGVSASDLVCGELKQKHLQQIVRSDGKKMPGKTTRKTGSELLIIEPEFVEWSDTTEEYPVVFQSIGTWDADSSVEPPEGFVSDYDTLSENVDNELEAVQFVLTDIGSEWVPTGTQHVLRHNGRKQVVLSRVGVRVAEGLAKAKGLDRDGHPLGPDGKPKPHPGFDPRYEWPVEIAGWIEPSAVDEGWTLNLRVNRATDLELAITRGQGKIVKLLGSGSYAPGEHAFAWDSDGLDQGKYFLRLTAGDLVQKVELLEK